MQQAAPEPEAGRVYFLPFIRSDYRYAGGKACVAVIGNNKADWAQPRASDVRRLGAGCWYNWHYDPAFGGAEQDFGEYVPMIWGKRVPGDLTCPPAGAPLLWLNEPDLRSQSNATPHEAVEMLAALRERCPTARFVGPQMGPFDPSYRWLREFWALWVERHGGPPPTTLAIHTYNAPEPLAWVDALYVAVPEYSGLVWVTEFGYCGNADPVAMMARYVADFLADDRVERFMPFAARIDAGTQDFAWLSCGSMFDERDRLTAVGRAYRDAAAARQRAEAYP